MGSNSFLSLFPFIFTANLALASGLLIHLVGWSVVYGVLGVDETKYSKMDGGTKIILAIIYPNVGLQWGINVMNMKGSQWSNLFESSKEGDPITMGVVWILFLVNIILYGTITWYIDSVHPGPYGVAKKWYFCFQVRYNLCLLKFILCLSLIHI